MKQAKTAIASAVLLLAIITAPASKALTIDFLENFECDKFSTLKILGCYNGNTKEIKIYNKLDIIQTISVIIHEVGHYYTINEDLSLFENYEIKGVYKTEDNAEKAAESFKKYIYKREMGLTINKPYIKYIYSPDVFEYKTGQKIEFKEAMEKDIWDDIQELPFLRKIITQEQEVFFDNLFKN